MFLQLSHRKTSNLVCHSRPKGSRNKKKASKSSLETRGDSFAIDPVSEGNSTNVANVPRTETPTPTLTKPSPKAKDPKDVTNVPRTETPTPTLTKPSPEAKDPKDGTNVANVPRTETPTPTLTEPSPIHEPDVRALLEKYEPYNPEHVLSRTRRVHLSEGEPLRQDLLTLGSITSDSAQFRLYNEREKRFLFKSKVQTPLRTPYSNAWEIVERGMELHHTYIYPFVLREAEGKVLLGHKLWVESIGYWISVPESLAEQQIGQWINSGALPTDSSVERFLNPSSWGQIVTWSSATLGIEISELSLRHLALRNGLLDLETFKLGPKVTWSSPITPVRGVNAEYINQTISHKSMEYFLHLASYDPARVNLIRHLILNCVMRRTNESTIYVLSGARGTGKSTALKFLNSLNQGSTVNMTLKNVGEHHHVGQVAGNSLLLIDEAAVSSLTKDSRENLRRFATGEVSNANDKYKQPYTFTPRLNIVIACPPNQDFSFKPSQNMEQDDGLTRRLVQIPIDFPALSHYKMNDPENPLVEDIGGILNWCSILLDHPEIGFFDIKDAETWSKEMKNLYGQVQSIEHAFCQFFRLHVRLTNNRQKTILLGLGDTKKEQEGKHKLTNRFRAWVQQKYPKLWRQVEGVHLDYSGMLDSAMSLYGLHEDPRVQKIRRSEGYVLVGLELLENDQAVENWTKNFGDKNTLQTKASNVTNRFASIDVFSTRNPQGEIEKFEYFNCNENKDLELLRAPYLEKLMRGSPLASEHTVIDLYKELPVNAADAPGSAFVTSGDDLPQLDPFFEGEPYCINPTAASTYSQYQLKGVPQLITDLVENELKHLEIIRNPALFESAFVGDLVACKLYFSNICKRHEELPQYTTWKSKYPKADALMEDRELLMTYPTAMRLILPGLNGLTRTLLDPELGGRFYEEMLYCLKL